MRITHEMARYSISPLGHDGDMRVVHVVSRSQRRGAERAALDLARALDELGCTNRLVSLARGFDGSELDELPPLTPTSDLGWRAFPTQVRALRHALVSDRADIVLAHGGRAAEVAVWARPHRQPVVWQRILGFPPAIKRQPRRFWWQQIVRRIDAVVALDEPLEREVRDLGYRGTTRIIPNFRDTTRFEHLDHACEAERLRAALGIDTDAPLLGFVGHLTAQKRPDRALAVLAEVHRLGASNAHLVIAGDGPERKDVERTVRAGPLNAYVHILGEREDVERILAGIDVFVMTSDDEGTPGVLIEAALAGVCVVSPNIGAIASVVQDGKTGLLTDRPDANAIAACVFELLADTERRRQMGSNAQQFAERFSSTRAAHEYFACFETLVRERSSRASDER